MSVILELKCPSPLNDLYLASSRDGVRTVGVLCTDRTLSAGHCSPLLTHALPLQVLDGLPL